MKTLILAGGYGSRLGNVTENIPKPMVPIGGKPILWHIMKIYSHYGFKDFIILIGYAGIKIKEYFFNYHMMTKDFTINLADNRISYSSKNNVENWNVTLIDTGIDTFKGSRIKQAEQYITDNTNMLTYGDGVGNINIEQLLSFHRSHGKVITVTGVRPPSRFGELMIEKGRALAFREKPQVSSGIINGGFMVFEREFLSYLTSEKDCDLEFGVLDKLAREGQVMVYEHGGFWGCVDTERDLRHLNKLWAGDNAFWKVWQE